LKVIHKIVASLAGAALLLGIAGSFWAFRQIEEAGAARKHSFGVIESANELLSELRDAETGQRGYVLTGDKNFLEPYSAVRDGIDDRLDDLRKSIFIVAARKHAVALAPLIDAKMAELARVIELRRRNDITAAIATVRAGRGKRLMDSIRVEIRGLVQIEEGALARHDADFQADMRRLFALIEIASLTVLLLALSFAYLIYRETQQQLKNIVHLETKHLLEIQEKTNQQLQQANVTLQVSEEKLAVTLNSIGDGVIATDAEGRVTLLNPLAERLTGWPRAEAVGVPVNEIFHIVNQETRKPAAVPVAETLAHGTIQGLANHTVLIARHGGECAIADSCAPIRDRDGRVAGAVLVFRDVTKEYAANAEVLTAKSAAEKASLAKSDFLSSMSHELRSPLNAILGFAQLLDSASPPPTAPQKGNIAQILKAGWHLLTLINEVLDLAVVESGKMSVSMEPVSLAEVLSECRAMMEPQARRRGISMTFTKLDIPCFVLADRTRVKQVLINLISNAIKYNRERGTVEVKYGAAGPERVRISVKDAGAGLSSEQLSQLFQPFNRLGQESGAEEGTGIGLVMSKRLVELMGGSVVAESALGVGSVFWFELSSSAAPQLPVNGAEPEAAAPAKVHRGAASRTLLYVEDNPANLTLVELLIARRPDLRLLTAVNENVGIEVARANQPDVILMDINLPGISGVEAMKVLREDPVTAHIPIVALSANAMPSDIKKGLEAGFYRYLTKPIRVNEFMETLDAALAFAEKNSPDALSMEPI
jgi:PAS domain S-box-containing protein